MRQRPTASHSRGAHEALLRPSRPPTHRSQHEQHLRLVATSWSGRINSLASVLAENLYGAPAGGPIRNALSAAAYLRRLVEGEVRRRVDHTVAGVSLEAPEPDQALAALAEVRASIDELDEIAGRLARSATAHGASWEDVGSSLRLKVQQAREAFGRPA